MRRAFLLAFVLLFAAVSFGSDYEPNLAQRGWWYSRYQQFGNTDPRWDGLVKEGIERWVDSWPKKSKRADLDAAIAALQQAIDRGCNDAIVNYICGAARHTRGGGDHLAPQYLHRALAAAVGDPRLKFVEFHSNRMLGWHYFYSGEYDQAKKHFAAADAVQGDDIALASRDDVRRGLRRAGERAAEVEEQRAATAAWRAGWAMPDDLSAEERRRVDLLRRAYEALETEFDAFLGVLRSIKDLLPEIPSGMEPWTCRFVTCSLNVHGQGMDAVRFRVPPGEPRDMVWCHYHAYNQSFHQWQIVPARGGQIPPTTSRYSKYIRTGTPDGQRYLQDRHFQFVPARHLKPGEEYLLWFGFRGGEPTDLQIAINFLPAGQVANTLAGIAEALGQQDEADIPREFSRRWWWSTYRQLGEPDPRWDALVKRGIERWQDAFCEGGGPADLEAAVASFDASFAAGCGGAIATFMRAHAQFRLDPYGSRAHLLLREARAAAAGNPEFHFIAFHANCCLGWYYYRNGQPQPAIEHFTAALALPREGIDDESLDDAELGLQKAGDYLAAGMSVSPPAPPAPDEARRVATLKEARQALDADYGRFVDLLQSAAPLLPEAPVGVVAGTASHTLVRLNVGRQRLDAVRFRVPPGARTDMVWTFYVPDDVSCRWAVVPTPEARYGGYSYYHYTFEEILAPHWYAREAERTFNYRPGRLRDDFHYHQASVEVQGPSGMPHVAQRFMQIMRAEYLTPGEEYIIWFDLDTDMPVDVPVAINCLPAGEVADAFAAKVFALGLEREIVLKGVDDPRAYNGERNGGRADDWVEKRDGQPCLEMLPLSEALLARFPEEPPLLLMHHRELKVAKRYREAEEFGLRALPIVERSGDRVSYYWLLWDQMDTLGRDARASPDPAHVRSLAKYDPVGLADRLRDVADELDNDNMRWWARYLRGGFVLRVPGVLSPDETIAMQKEAIEIAERHGWLLRIRYNMSVIAGILMAEGRIDEGMDWSARSGTKFSHITTALVHNQEWDRVLSSSLTSMSTLESKTVRALNERLQRGVVGQYERSAFDYGVLAYMNLKQPEGAIQTAERLHNRTLGTILGALADSAKRAAMIRNKGRQAVLERKVEALKAEVARASTAEAGKGAALQRDLQVQSAALKQLTADITADELEIKATDLPSVMPVKEMQALLDRDTALIMYFATWQDHVDDGLIAVITRDTYSCRLQKGLFIGSVEGRGLQPLIDPYLKSLLDMKRTAESAAELARSNGALYDLLLGPIAEDIRAKRHLIIVPCGPLSQVPIHLLRESGGGHLLESHSVSYAQSVGVLRYALTRERKAAGPVTVVANPALPDPGARLVYAEDEAAAIREVFPEADVLLEDQATETAVKSVLSTAGILHFACHGLLDVDFPMQSSLALAPDDQNDGLLTAREVCDYPVSAGLVTLSACESGSGALSSGWVELVGMSRAWLLAGAPSVMVSLWKLDDRATSELMGEFYRNLKSMSRAEALRRAQLTMMQKYDNPYYWGAFVLYGDYR